MYDMELRQSRRAEFHKDSNVERKKIHDSTCDKKFNDFISRLACLYNIFTNIAWFRRAYMHETTVISAEVTVTGRSYNS